MYEKKLTYFGMHEKTMLLRVRFWERKEVTYCNGGGG